MCEKKYIDAAFSNEKIEDEEVSDFFSTYAKDYMLERIKETLENMGIKFDI
jgi:arginyl-tRNA synthetase